MSEIFNALQRSESTGTAKDTIGPLRALDLLRHAEELAQTKWDQTAGIVSPPSEEIAALETLLGQRVLESTTVASSQTSDRSVASVHERVTHPGQFRAISANITPDSHLVTVPRRHRQPCSRGLPPTWRTTAQSSRNPFAATHPSYQHCSP